MLTGENWGFAGGAEVEQVHLGRELARRGYDVSFVTYDHGIGQVENVQGIEILKTYARHRATELNIFQKLRLIWKSLRRAKADLYFHESGAPGMLAFFARLNKKKFVYRIPSDVIFSEALSEEYCFRKEIVDTIEIKAANAVVTQNSFQKDVLRTRFKVESVTIKNGLEIPLGNLQKLNPPTVLWVGRISSVKRPQLFVELARAIPQAHFQMIGGKSDGEWSLYDEIRRRAIALPNLDFRGFIPYHNVDIYFRKASLFVNTSSKEGFPNTFIQAGAHYTPIISLNVDPDKIIQNEKLGVCSGTFEQLVSDVTALLKNKELRKNMGENARRYVEREHDIRRNVKEYIRIFEEIS